MMSHSNKRLKAAAMVSAGLSADGRAKPAAPPAQGAAPAAAPAAAADLNANKRKADAPPTPPAMVIAKEQAQAEIQGESDSSKFTPHRFAHITRSN